MDMTKGIMDFAEKLSASQQHEAMDTSGGEGSRQKISPSPFSNILEDSDPSTNIGGKTNTDALMVKPMQDLVANSSSTTSTTNTLTTTTTTASATSLAGGMGTNSSGVASAGAFGGRSCSSERLLNNDGDLTPPPRPLTSSEVLGLTDPDPEMQVELPPKKSRSLPVSPNPLPHLAHMFQASFSTRPQININKASNLLDDSVDLRAKLRPNTINAKLGRSSATAAPTNSGPNQQFCLRWNNYQTNLTNVFDELLQNESFVDVTLACDGQSIKAHKMVLSACSPYFQALFYDNPCQHPIIIMRDVRWQELKALMEFMYKGEINVSQDQINPLLKVAEMLKIRGLAEVGNGGPGAMAAHAMVPEQRMTVYDDDEVDDLSEEPNEDDDVVRALAAVANEEDPDVGMSCPRAKRARLMDPLLPPHYKLPLDLNLGNQMQRKRSRDGNLIDMEMREGRRSPATPLPTQRTESTERCKTPHSNASAIAPLAMTSSTIVRNPFASPNSSAITNTSSNERSATNLASSNMGNSTAPTGPAGCLTGTPASNQNFRCSSPIPSTGGSALSSPVGPSATGGRESAHHMPGLGPHHPSHHGHHHHAAAAAQQLAAQHQFQAAAHSHAMASALAAAAVGGPGGPGNSQGPSSHHDDLEIKPEIAEMIREEERAKMIEGGGHPWMGGASTSSVADSYQYQLQSMWQKCWNTNQQNLMQQLRFRERGPLKSWRPEAMAEAIFSVLKEGLSLSQAARKYDIPYPTFVLYANRVHNMLGPSLDGGTDPRPKARGRPQRILLGMWPEELIRSVIKAVVFRDYREIKDEMTHPFVNGQPHPQSPFGPGGNGGGSANGYHNAGKMSAQNVPLAPPDSTSPLSSMPESLRRQILSQQQQSPLSQSLNMYKSPAYLQRSEMEDQLGVVKAGDRRGSENMPDLSALGLMGIPGLHVLPPQSHRGANPLQQNMANYSRERERERERERDREREREREREKERERDRDRERERERERERDRDREREFKEAIQARQFGNQSRDSTLAAVAAGQKPGSGPTGPMSPFPHFKSGKDHPNYAYNKRFLENLPQGIDLEAIALLQKSVNKSPRFEDFFPGQDMNELFANNENVNHPGYHPPPSVRESPLMKIKLEHQHATELPHED